MSCSFLSPRYIFFSNVYHKRKFIFSFCLASQLSISIHQKLEELGQAPKRVRRRGNINIIFLLIICSFFRGTGPSLCLFDFEDLIQGINTSVRIIFFDKFS
ncbi:hypothetical protein S83_060337 [Arachis hypogaea]